MSIEYHLSPDEVEVARVHWSPFKRGLSDGADGFPSHMRTGEARPESNLWEAEIVVSVQTVD